MAAQKVSMCPRFLRPRTHTLHQDPCILRIWISWAIMSPIKLIVSSLDHFQTPIPDFYQSVVDSEKDDGTGLIGLGPNANSQIHSALNNDKGNAVIDRIFLQNSSTPNYLTVLLGRSDDPDEADRLPGEITIGELVEGRENITSQPKLPVNRVGKGVSTLNQHWQSERLYFRD